jgi:DNA-directed RNA polymerase subunit RPC12/RpoP
MRFCYNCSRITPSTAKGEQPLFCQTCGRTFDTKYCHRLHPNPRSAVVCSQCGSKELSTPQPKVPFYIVPLLWLLTILPGFVLLAATVAFFAWFISTLISNQQLLGSAMAVGLIFALLWLMYLHLPDLVRKAIGKRLFGRTSGHKEHSGH